MNGDRARPTLCFKTRGLLLLVGPPRLPPVEPAAAPATPRRASAGGRAALGEGGGGRQHQGVGHVDAEAVGRGIIIQMKCIMSTGWGISSRTWVGLTLIWRVPRLVGRYCRYLLPKHDGGTFQI